jgi:DNA polymerase (family 10)
LIDHGAILPAAAPLTPGGGVGSVRLVTNAEIAEALRELGILYELDGADRYRILAYENAAKTVSEWPQSLEQMSHEGRLQELPGVGKTLAEKITALVETGTIPAADELKKRIPEGLVQVTRVPGLGSKTASRLHTELGVEDLDGLRAAAEQGQIRELKGLGEKVENNILEGLDSMEKNSGDAGGRVLLSKVLPLAEQLIEDLSAVDGCKRIEPGGSVRRWADTCHDLDLVAASDDPEALIEAFTSHPLVSKVDSSGEAGASVTTNSGIQIDLRLTGPETYGNLLQHFTGSMEHNVELRERAQDRGLSVSEHGVTEVGKRKRVHRFDDEHGVYELLGLEYIEPELREGRGEIEAAEAGNLPALVELGQIRGELHSHTTLSDGKNGLAEMAKAAKELGYSYLAITDHSASHGFGTNVDEKALRKRISEIKRFNTKAPKGFRLLSGSEVNILPDGSLDYSDELLSDLDWVIASVHTSFGKGEKAMTDRIIAACEHPWVDCIGHLTGRLLLDREPYPLDIEAVVEAAARTGTMLEINGNPKRRDLSDRHARLASEAGVKIVLTTDAHSTEGFEFMRYAVATARRGWLEAADVANTRPWRSFAPLRKRHGRA